MRFKYTAADSNGRITESEIEGIGVADVLKEMAIRGLRPVSITPVKAPRVVSYKFFGSSISVKEQILLTRYLSLMLRVGMDLFTSIKVLIENFENPALKSFLEEVRLNLEKGNPFYTVFARYPRYFSPVFVSLLRAGEASGTLEKVFDSLSVNLEREDNLRQTIRSALVYPAVLFSLATLVLLFLVTFALPRIANVFQGGGFEPPTFSRVVFAVGNSMGSHVVLVFGGFFAFLFGLIIFFRTTEGKQFLVRMLGRMPVVRTVVQKVALQRFATTLSSLLLAGLPMLESLEITASVVGHEKYELALKRIAREGLSKGKTIGEAFRNEPVFPGVIINLVAISEKTGHLADILQTLARFYEEEIGHGIKRLVVFLEPMMLLIIGAVVGLIALSIIVPIYQLVGSFR